MSNSAADLAPQAPATHRRVSWDRIHAYARRFAEYEIVRAIEAEATSRRIEITPAAPRPNVLPIGVARSAFGPVSTGTPLGDGWEVAGLSTTGGRVRIQLARGETIVWLALAPPGTAGPGGPFDRAGLRISYERTQVPFAAFENPGRVLADRFAAALPNGFDEPTWRKWLDDPRARLRTHRLPDADAVEIRADGKIYLRVTDACQERCVFCFFYDTDEIDNLVRHHDFAGVVERLPVENIRQVILTGGEPTLNPALPDLVGTLHRRGFREIILQTNGIRLDAAYLARLAPYRDRLGIGFSLHAATEATNDRLTTVEKGYFARKLDALEGAARAGFRTKVTLVLNRLNLSELVAFVELVHARAGTGDVFVQFSLPSFEGRMNRFLDTYPRLEEIALAAPPAFRRARELDLRVALCHQCQVPPCIVPDDVQHLESMWFADTPGMWNHDRAYGRACDSCALRPRCSGVWKGYADMFGLEALKPFGPEEVDPILATKEP